MKINPPEIVDGRSYHENASSAGAYAVYDAATDKFLGYTDTIGYLTYDTQGRWISGCKEPPEGEVNVVFLNKQA